MKGEKKVIVVGQTPPPYHGQAVMIQKLLEGDYGEIHLLHVRMNFSSTMEEIGRLRVGKLHELFRVFARIWQFRFRMGARVLYYPPAGPRLIPVLRDLLLLSLVRPFFARTIFHFHAGGVGAYVARLPTLLQPFVSRAYARADVAIRLSPLAPEDGAALHAQQDVIVPYGIEDLACRGYFAHPRAEPIILFVGMLSEDKGLQVLLEACRNLAQRGASFRTIFVGAFSDPAVEHEAQTFVARHGLTDRIHFAGVLTGDSKWKMYAEADIFCFPTHYEAETFGVVLLEAMCFSLPIVTTRRRGIPSVVDEGCAFLVPPQNAEAVANYLAKLIKDTDLRRRMGAHSRERFLAHFTLDRFHERMREVFESVFSEDGLPPSV